ncbi:hypothetical protein SFRURICE_009281 [Spodoptera frugiperda]|nr:hypothetical protein SFRURICE_009281 [Spodoptera frugiperda]
MFMERFEHKGRGKFSSGQYTYKIYHLASKVPAFIRLLAPKGSLEVHEEAWNAYPYCRTVLTNPGYMKENFVICIESLHLPDAGDQYNSKVENVIQKSERRLFTIFHRQVFCSIDDWFGMTMADIRAIEDRTKEELEKLRRQGEVRGMRADNE